MSALAAVNSLNPSNVKTSSRFPTFIRGFLSLFVNSALQRRSDLGQVSWRHREERRGAAAGVVSRKQNLSNRFQQLSPGEGLYQRSGKLEPRASACSASAPQTLPMPSGNKLAKAFGAPPASVQEITKRRSPRNTTTCALTANRKMAL